MRHLAADTSDEAIKDTKRAMKEAIKRDWRYWDSYVYTLQMLACDISHFDTSYLLVDLFEEMAPARRRVRPAPLQPRAM